MGREFRHSFCEDRLGVHLSSHLSIVRPKWVAERSAAKSKDLRLFFACERRHCSSSQSMTSMRRCTKSSIAHTLLRAEATRLHRYNGRHLLQSASTQEQGLRRLFCNLQLQSACLVRPVRASFQCDRAGETVEGLVPSQETCPDREDKPYVERFERRLVQADSVLPYQVKPQVPRLDPR